MDFPLENLEIWVNTGEYSHPIETVTYPPFTKGTYMFSTIPTKKKNSAFKLDLCNC